MKKNLQNEELQEEEGFLTDAQKERFKNIQRHLIEARSEILTEDKIFSFINTLQSNIFNGIKFWENYRDISGAVGGEPDSGKLLDRTTNLLEEYFISIAPKLKVFDRICVVSALLIEGTENKEFIQLVVGPIDEQEKLKLEIIDPFIMLDFVVSIAVIAEDFGHIKQVDSIHQKILDSLSNDKFVYDKEQLVTYINRSGLNSCLYFKNIHKLKGNIFNAQPKVLLEWFDQSSNSHIEKLKISSRVQKAVNDLQVYVSPVCISEHKDNNMVKQSSLSIYFDNGTSEDMSIDSVRVIGNETEHSIGSEMSIN